MPATYLALALAGLAAALPSIRPAPKPAAEPPPVGVRRPLAVSVGDKLSDSRLTYLAARSATMKQVLGMFEMTPAISVRLRSNPMLWRESGLRAIGRFSRDGAQLIVLLQFDSSARPAQQIESVAHEMAHAVEVACLPHPIGLDQLRSQLLRRGRTVAAAPGSIETPFATEAGLQIFLEALRGRPGIGKLPELAGKHKLGAPCADRSSVASQEFARKIRRSGTGDSPTLGMGRTRSSFMTPSDGPWSPHSGREPGRG